MLCCKCWEICREIIAGCWAREAPAMKLTCTFFSFFIQTLQCLTADGMVFRLQSEFLMSAWECFMLKFFRKWSLVLFCNVFSSTDSQFQLTSTSGGFCLVKINAKCRDVRWTTSDRLLVQENKKCLGVLSKTEGSEINFQDCDENSELQKWECRNETVLALKDQDLYIELNADNAAILSKTVGANNHLTIAGTVSGACTRTYRGTKEHALVLVSQTSNEQCENVLSNSFTGLIINMHCWNLNIYNI